MKNKTKKISAIVLCIVTIIILLTSNVSARNQINDNFTPYDVTKYGVVIVGGSNHCSLDPPQMRFHNQGTRIWNLLGDGTSQLQGLCGIYPVFFYFNSFFYLG